MGRDQRTPMPSREVTAGICVPSPKRRRTQSSTKPLPLPGHGFRTALPRNYPPYAPTHPLPTINQDQARPPQWRRRRPAHKGQRGGSRTLLSTCNLHKKWYSLLWFDSWPSLYLPLFPTNLVKVFLSSCGCNSDPKTQRNSQLNKLIEEPTTHIPRGKQISSHVVQIVHVIQIV